MSWAKVQMLQNKFEIFFQSQVQFLENLNVSRSALYSLTSASCNDSVENTNKCW